MQSSFSLFTKRQLASFAGIGTVLASVFKALFGGEFRRVAALFTVLGQLFGAAKSSARFASKGEPPPKARNSAPVATAMAMNPLLLISGIASILSLSIIMPNPRRNRTSPDSVFFWGVVQL